MRDTDSHLNSDKGRLSYLGGNPTSTGFILMRRCWSPCCRGIPTVLTTFIPQEALRSLHEGMGPRRRGRHARQQGLRGIRNSIPVTGGTGERGLPPVEEAHLRPGGRQVGREASSGPGEAGGE